MKTLQCFAKNCLHVVLSKAINIGPITDKYISAASADSSRLPMILTTVPDRIKHIWAFMS